MQRFISHWGQFKPCLCIVQLSGPSHGKRHCRSALVRIYLGEIDRLYINPCSLLSPLSLSLSLSLLSLSLSLSLSTLSLSLSLLCRTLHFLALPKVYVWL